MTGTWDGVPIEVRLARGEAARTVTWVAALFRVDLPKGLDIRSAAEAPTAGTEIPVGDPDLEATLRVCARDAADAQALLGSAHVLDALRAFATTGPAAAITGRRAICAFPGFLGDPEALAAALNRATRTVRAIEAARIWPSAARKSPEPEKSRAPEVVFHPRPAPAPEAGPAAGQRAPASISLVGHAIQTDEHTRARRARRS